MKRILCVLACIALLGICVFPQTGDRQRPRIVQSQTKKPPVLEGDKKKTETQPQTTEETPLEDDSDEVIKIETNLVTIPVSVLDRDGRFISGLAQQDFQIFENGVKQKIEYFANVEQPFTVVLLIDVSRSTELQIEEIHDAAIAFTNQLRPNDRVAVISFDEQVHVLSPATNNRNVLRNAIRQARYGQGTSLYEAVDQTINRHIRQIEGRKAVVLFTDGVDTTSRFATFQSTVRDAEEAEALIYPIRYDTFDGNQGGGYNPYPRRRRNRGDILGDILGGIIIGGGRYPQGGGGGVNGTRQEYETGRRYLEQLAQNSGGRFFEANRDLNAAFRGIAEELRRQYSIGYSPERVGQKGERRQIKVRVMRPNLVVRARNSYIVGENAGK